MHTKQETKQKVTLHLSPELHRKLKIRSVMDSETMSGLAERAISFYLAHSEVIAELEESIYGGTHRVYPCPSCLSSLVLKDGELIALGRQPGIIGQDDLCIESQTHPRTEEELVPC
ncbi:hypothetical protein CEP10_07755 [Cylindrospermopsis raciborskii S07]|jgi:hypothetical protein|uniref:Uncharacterized protein n=3 Tax=Cylindrospermopsis raciborskii TaxID=77022 RepID=A0A853MB13_9CYAN|nr:MULTISPECIES: hypothetical protein [Cylindrospermopsis]MBU6345351.1 hypothetical protein [Cyanobacteria bacterium REEB494]KRH97799.1 hypothetical protein ASL19_14345 [Cylindrospermopsis sp. CR12]MBA4444279.1 hypothetical protein [Cylindrospermopsis raciborskii CS-506_C]MBA4448500.1 hypothetical protein [Cylindrospermopsis raciborskii CS-506_D]MBA4455126.1 hypothetical protein [Cylindrospermopsis raciborskii CS-506_B]